MDLLIKGIDNNENKCKVCGNEIYSDIIIEKGIVCEYCNKAISNISVDNFEYEYYKNKIKDWLFTNYNFK